MHRTRAHENLTSLFPFPNGTHKPIKKQTKTPLNSTLIKVSYLCVAERWQGRKGMSCLIIQTHKPPPHLDLWLH